MIITLTHNSYTMTDVAISNVHHKHNRSLYYLLTAIVIWLLFTPHFESLLCITQIAMTVIAIASGVILADLEDELPDLSIRFVFNLF